MDLLVFFEGMLITTASSITTRHHQLPFDVIRLYYSSPFKIFYRFFRKLGFHVVRAKPLHCFDVSGKKLVRIVTISKSLRLIAAVLAFTYIGHSSQNARVCNRIFSKFCQSIATKSSRVEKINYALNKS